MLIRLKNFKSIFKNLSKINDESKFRLVTMAKFVSIPIITFIILFCVIWLFLKMNLIYFVTKGFHKGLQLEDAFYQFITAQLLDYVPYFIIFLFILLFAGLYISELIIRPFKIIGEYCEQFQIEAEAIYDPDFFVDLKILTRFSEYFFNIIENAIKNERLEKIDIPRKFQKIHKPVFEGGFFLQFFIYVLIFCLISGYMIYFAILDIYEGLIKLSTDVLKLDSKMTYFFGQQYEILENISIVIFIMYILFYFLLSWHLYHKVSGPAFGFFATMRSYLKGDYSARVHLLGYYYIRAQSRKFNKFLDKISRELELKKSTK